MAKDLTQKLAHHTGLDRLFRYAEFLNFGDVHVKFDHATGLRAVVAIHNLKRGPAIGGCRLVRYASSDAAIEDVLRLAYMMSYKSAISGLPHGGAKSVILLPKVIKNRQAFFESFGSFIQDLGGRYITAVDSGTSPSDMDIIARKTSFVTCTTASGHSGDPSPETAFGVRRAIQAAVKFKLNKNDLAGIHVTLQGAGNVGYYLAKELHALGAKLTICDINQAAVARCVKEFNAKEVSVAEIFDVPADVFAPCALGAVLNLDTIRRLKVSIVAGSANNQLAHHQYGAALHDNGILYAPDFVVNAGGLIQVAMQYGKVDSMTAKEKISDIYHTVMKIFARAQVENLPTNEVAEAMAIEMLK